MSASVRLRCLELANQLDPFSAIRRRLEERLAEGDHQAEPPAVERTIALARQLEAYVLTEEGPTG